MVTFQLLDSDYFLNGNKPVVRLFGKTASGKAVCAMYDKFQPYFYVKAKNVEKLKEVAGVVETEEVERFTPLGYKGSPEKVVKITITNPQEVPKIREKLIQENLIIDSYESDILFKYRFMIDHGLRGMEWVEAETESTFTKTVKVPAYHIKKIKPVKTNKNAPLRTMAIDIECLPRDLKREMDPKKDNIIMISLAFDPDYRGKKTLILVAKPATGTNVKGLSNEKEMLEDFVKIMDDFDPDIVTGYNCNNFDIPYILERMRTHKIPQNFGRCTDKYAYVTTYGMTEDCRIQGRVVVDPYQILRRDPWVKFHRYNLNTIAKEMLNEEKLDVEHGDIPGLWSGTKQDLSKLIEYSRKDVVLSIRLVLEKGLLDKFFELAKISGLLLQDTFGGQSTRVETSILHEFKKRNYIMPSKPDKPLLAKRLRERTKKGLKGAIVLEPIKGLHSEGCVLVLDFKSLYPSIMRTYNVSPDSVLPDDTKLKSHKSPSGATFVDKEIHEGLLPRILTDLTQARAKIKAEMKKASGEKKRILNAKQLALKDMSNSFYGYTGYIRARLYMIDVANTITSYGRENIEKTKKLIEDNFPVKVVYGDTDSIFLKTDLTDLDKAKALGEKISGFVTNKLPGELELEFEKIYRTFLILTKKRYAGWKFEYTGDKWQDSMEMKGIETVRRDWCPLVSETMERVLEIILKEGDIEKTINEVRTVLDKLKKNQIPLEKLTVIKGITKRLSSYEGKLPHIELARKLAQRSPSNAPNVGDRLGFVIIRGNQLLSMRAEDPEYVKKKGLQIDSDYYIQSQLFPPIERIISSMGITKSELLGNGRQTNIFDIISGKKRKTKHDIKLDFKEQPPETVLKGFECFVCNKCSKKYRRMPLQGSCECGGELLISHEGSVGKKIKRK